MRKKAQPRQKSYPRSLNFPHNLLTHPARALCEASRGARVGQPDPLASRARCGQGDRPSPHGMRETVCGISRFLKWPDRNPVLGLPRSGPVPRLSLRRPPPRNPSASCFTLLFAPSDSASRSRPDGACPVPRSSLHSSSRPPCAAYSVAHGDSPPPIPAFAGRPPCPAYSVGVVSNPCLFERRP
jgi:hypothetical protein